MDVKFLTNQIALLLPVRGQTEFCKLTASDSPHPILLLAHLLPPPSFLFPPGALLSRLLAHLFDLSARKRNERRHFDDFRLRDRKNQKRDSVTSCSTGDSEIFKLDEKFLRHSNLLSSNRHPTYLTWRTWVQRRFGGNVSICCLIFLILIPVSFYNNILHY